jgi:glutaredoxin-related protein
MLSSLLGEDTPKYQPSLPEIREEDSSVYVSPRSLQAYTGPGRTIDPTYISDSRLNIDAAPVANKMKAVLGSIEKLKTSSHLSLKGSSSQINSQSNAAISQVINALHTHDQTMKNLKDALNEIDIVTQESTMERKSSSRLGSLTQINRSQRILNNNDAAAMITKEWVQNEVEIQIDYLRKSLNIDAIQNILLQLKKEKIEEKEYRDHVKELIKHEVNDQFVEIRDSNQNLQGLDKVKDQMQIEIINDLKKQLRLILSDETKKIISTVSEKVPEYVTESALQSAIEEALKINNTNNSNNDGVIEKMVI